MTNEKNTYLMSNEESLRIIELLSDAINEDRSSEEVFNTFLEAGIIAVDGELETPYEELTIPID